MGCTRKTVIVHVALLLSQCLFSGSHVMGRLAFDYIQPIWWASWQRLFGLPAFVLLSYMIESPRLLQEEESAHRREVDSADYSSPSSFSGYSPLKRKRRSCCVLLPPHHLWIKLILSGLFGYWLQTVFFVLALKESSAGQAGIFQPLTAVFTTIFAIILKMERFNWWKVVGIILAVGGVMVITIVPFVTSDTSDDASAYGAMLFVGNTFSFSIGLIFTKQILASGFPPILATAYGYLFAIVLLFPTSLPFDNPVPPFDWPTMTWVAVLYTSYCAGFLGYALLNSAAVHVWPSVVSIYITVQPVSSSLFGYIFLHEELTATDGIGAVLIFLGVITVISVKIREAAVTDETQSLLTTKHSDSNGNNSSSNGHSNGHVRNGSETAGPNGGGSAGAYGAHPSHRSVATMLMDDGHSSMISDTSSNASALHDDNLSSSPSSPSSSRPPGMTPADINFDDLRTRSTPNHGSSQSNHHNSDTTLV